MFDCIIVGAGPGGSAAAYHLAKARHSVLVLEKATLPRYRPCTGAVSPSVADWFDFDFSPAIDSQIRQVRYTWKLSDAVDGTLETAPIWCVRREVFDQFLVEQAQAVGAEVRDQITVVGIEFREGVDGRYWQVSVAGGEPLTCRYLIGADGPKGPMAEWLGFRKHKLRSAGIFEARTAAPVEGGAFNFEFGLAKNGCLWSFPKQEGYSFGVSSFIGNSVKAPEKLLQSYSSDFGVSAEQGEFYTHPLKLWDGNHSLHFQQALLVGEAAAIVDPLTAEGIRPAMYSGMEAAKAISAVIAGNTDALAGYTQTIHKNWGADMQWAQRIAQVYFRLPKIGYRVGIKRPTATKRLGQILAGEIGYVDIANRVIKRISSSLIPGRS